MAEIVELLPAGQLEILAGAMHMSPAGLAQRLRAAAARAG